MVKQRDMKKAVSFLSDFSTASEPDNQFGKQCISWYVHTFRKLPWYGRTGMGILTGIGMLIVLLVMIDSISCGCSENHRACSTSKSLYSTSPPRFTVPTETDWKILFRKPYTGGIQGYFSDTGQDAGLHGGRTLLQAFRYRL